MSKIIGKVIESTQSIINIVLDSIEAFEENKQNLKIGKYLSIEEGNFNRILGIIQSIKTYRDEKESSNSYLITVQPVGSYIEDNDGKIEFKQGGVNIPSPTELAHIPDDDIIEKIFSKETHYSFYIGKLANNDTVKFYVNGNKFFSKHIAVVGSTGSGKSYAVAKLLQEAVGIKDGVNTNSEVLKNSHVIIFDIHSEYKAAFTLNERTNFKLNILDVEKMCLPYWLMNAEELESLFIESNEANSHNQRSQFKKAVILSKQKHNPEYEKITYDMPIFFDINEVYNYIVNMNNEVINKVDGQEHKPKLSNGELVKDKKKYLDSILKFAAPSTAMATKASNGPFNPDFERFITRLETKINDRRLDFMLSPKKENGELFITTDFVEIIKTFLGYIESSNVTIIDLSAIPFEVLSIVVSLLSRIIFDFAFHYSKLRHENKDKNDVPFLIVCEEAHNYIPQNNDAEYTASKKSLERIAKEGRKYGLSLMVVSQRPSEVSDTIFSQCNNFIALRLTNANDQNYIKTLMPDNSNMLVDSLPTLSAGECIVVGDSAPMPAIVKLDKPKPTPESDSVDIYDEWQKDWVNAAFEDTVKRWRKES